MLGFAGMMFAVAGCQDATLPATSAPDLPSADVLIGEDYQSPACCDEVVVIAPGPTEPVCDPYTDANWCQDSGGECMTSLGGGEMQGLSGCDDGTGGSTGGSGGYTDGGGSTPSPDDTVEPEPGPLLWGACVLAVVGSVYTIDQVGAKFEAWWEAQKEYNRAKAAWQYAWDNQESLVDPSSLARAELRMQLAEQRRDDAVGAVRDLTGASVLALGAAAVTCAPSVFLPTA
ncbi:MAG TPA: hypothetical protein VF142_01775 [Longimicrobium sp.]